MRGLLWRFRFEWSSVQRDQTNRIQVGSFKSVLVRRFDGVNVFRFGGILTAIPTQLLHLKDFQYTVTAFHRTRPDGFLIQFDHKSF